MNQETDDKLHGLDKEVDCELVRISTGKYVEINIRLPIRGPVLN